MVIYLYLQLTLSWTFVFSCHSSDFLLQHFYNLLPMYNVNNQFIYKAYHFNKLCQSLWKKLFNNKSNNTTNVTIFFFFWVTIEVYRLWLLYNKMMLTITSYKNNFKLITISAALISCKKKFSKFVSWMWILYLFLAWSLIFLKVMK